MKPHPLAQYVVTDHARFQMERRGITEEHVRQVLKAPEQVVTVRPGRWVYQSRIALGSSGREYLTRVFVDVDRNPVEVVTVYCTSKLVKYWRDT